MFWNKDKKNQLAAGPEQSVLVSFDVDPGENISVQKQISEFTDYLEPKLQNIGAEYDGDEYGDNECNLYFYGPDAEKIYDLLSRTMDRLSIRPIRFKLRYGSVDDMSAREEERLKIS